MCHLTRFLILPSHHLSLAAGSYKLSSTSKLARKLILSAFGLPAGCLTPWKSLLRNSLQSALSFQSCPNFWHGLRAEEHTKTDAPAWQDSRFCTLRPPAKLARPTYALPPANWRAGQITTHCLIVGSTSAIRPGKVPPCCVVSTQILPSSSSTILHSHA